MALSVTVTQGKKGSSTSSGDNKSVFSTSPTDAGKESGDYPTTLPGLSKEQLGQLAARRRQVDSRFQETLARQGAEKSRVTTEGSIAANNIGRGFRRSTREGMGELASAGVARDPRMAGRFLRDQRDAESEERASLERDLAERRRALQMFVEDARRERDEELLFLDAEETNLRANLAALFPAEEWY